MKISIKLFFVEKIDAHISRVAVVEKDPSSWKKTFSKKNLSSFFVQIRPTELCADFFKKEMGLEIFNFRWFFGSEKLLFTIELLTKLDQQKIKNISHVVLEIITLQIILYNFCKIGLNLEELELLECALVISFFNENR